MEEDADDEGALTGGVWLDRQRTHDLCRVPLQCAMAWVGPKQARAEWIPPSPRPRSLGPARTPALPIVDPITETHRQESSLRSVQAHLRSLLRLFLSFGPLCTTSWPPGSGAAVFSSFVLLLRELSLFTAFSFFSFFSLWGWKQGRGWDRDHRVGTLHCAPLIDSSDWPGATRSKPDRHRDGDTCLLFPRRPGYAAGHFNDFIRQLQVQFRRAVRHTWGERGGVALKKVALATRWQAVDRLHCAKGRAERWWDI